MAETTPEGTSPDEQSILIMTATIRPPKWPTGSQRTLLHEKLDLSFLCSLTFTFTLHPTVHLSIKPSAERTGRQTDRQRGEKEVPQRRLHKSVCELNVELRLLGESGSAGLRASKRGFP